MALTFLQESNVHMIVFEGESGIGKSRLLDALVSLAKKNGCMVRQGPCKTLLFIALPRPAETGTQHSSSYYRFQLRGDLFFGDIP